MCLRNKIFVGKAINKNKELKMKKVLKKYIALMTDKSFYYDSEIVKTWIDFYKEEKSNNEKSWQILKN